MKNHFDKVIRKYKRTTKHLLVCPKEYRRQFLKDMERDLKQFMEENPSAESSDVVDYFGTPDKLAQTYLDNVPQEELVKYKYKRRYRTTISLTVLVFFFTILSMILYYRLNEYKIIYVEEKIEILDEDIE